MFLLIIYLYFLIPAAITEIFIVIAELVEYQLRKQEQNLNTSSNCGS